MFEKDFGIITKEKKSFARVPEEKDMRRNPYGKKRKKEEKRQIYAAG